jgi:hypothetical protein
MVENDLMLAIADKRLPFYSAHLFEAPDRTFEMVTHLPTVAQV